MVQNNDINLTDDQKFHPQFFHLSFSQEEQNMLHLGLKFNIHSNKFKRDLETLAIDSDSILDSVQIVKNIGRIEISAINDIFSQSRSSFTSQTKNLSLNL